jgi:hypothetical protein
MLSLCIPSRILLPPDNSHGAAEVCKNEARGFSSFVLFLMRFPWIFGRLSV